MPQASDDHRSGAQTVERALSLLQCFEGASAEIRLSELAHQTGLTVSTTHRLARVLTRSGYLVQNPDNERYRLGPALVVLGHRAQAGLGYDRAMQTLEALALETGESVNLGIRSAADVLVVLDVASTSPLRFAQGAGTRVPIHTSAMGKCLLAFSEYPDNEVSSLPELLRLTPNTITRRDQLAEELSHVRAQGWAVNDEERLPGVRAIATPVLGQNGVAVAAIAVQGPSVRIDDTRLTALVEPLQRAARTVALALAAI